MEYALKKMSCEYEKSSPEEETKKLVKSMRYSAIRNDPAKVKEFLANLSMYDTNGKLIKR